MDGAFERWVDGFLFSLSGPIYAGTNEIQRNIIADRVLQLPRGALMRFAFTDDQQLFAEGLRDLLAKECTPAHVRAAWDDGAGHDFALVEPPRARWACSACSCPRPPAGSAAPRSTSCCCSRSSVEAAVPGPVIETAAVVAPALLGDAADGRSAPPRSTARRTCPHAHVAVVVLVPGGVVRTDGATAHRGRRHRRRPPPLHRRRCRSSRSRTTRRWRFDRGALAAAAYLVGPERAHDRRRRRVRAPA